MDEWAEAGWRLGGDIFGLIERIWERPSQTRLEKSRECSSQCRLTSGSDSGLASPRLASHSCD